MQNATNLVLIDNVIYRVVGNSKSVWLQPSPVSITKADSWDETENNKISYRFVLNQTTDPRWRILLSEHFDYTEIEIQGTLLKLTCLPDELVALFAKLKAAILTANTECDREYQSLKSQILESKSVSPAEHLHNVTPEHEVAKIRSIDETFRSLV